jgi:hypothetical protein
MTSYFRPEFEPTSEGEGFRTASGALYLAMIIGMRGLLFTCFLAWDQNFTTERHWPGSHKAWPRAVHGLCLQPRKVRPIVENSSDRIDRFAAAQFDCSSSAVHSREESPMRELSSLSGPLPCAPATLPPEPGAVPRTEFVNSSNL